MGCKHLSVWAASVLVLSVLAPAGAAEPNQKDLQHAELPKDGTTCLFMGHSFFIPVAKSFDQHAKLNGFSKHKQIAIFSGGQSGTPGSLWKSKKKSQIIKKILGSGNIQLLGMTWGSVNSSYEDYKRWIDFALEHNPKTRFMIGLSWHTKGPERKAEEFTKATLESAQRFFEEKVAKLRKAYPGNSITVINYGASAAELKVRFEAGKLNGDCRKMVERKSGLFTDKFGHAGPMIIDLSALTWLKTLYGADFKEVKLARTYRTDLRAIAEKLVKYNDRFARK